MRHLLLNLIFPPQCLVCSTLVPTHGTLCLSCWQQVKFISPPFCACCGLPFEFTIGEGALCGECIEQHPLFSRARAAFAYDDASKALVLKLKYADQTYLARIYAVWLAKAGAELIAASDVIVPVPLHYFRLVGRRYNQSALLAQALSKQCKLPVIVQSLKRTRHTPPQTGLTRRERLENVHGAFSVPEKYKSIIKGKRILLVDDVYTTGATLKACTKALMKAGATAVDVLTLSRAVR